VPERAEYFTVCVAYKNIDSEGPSIFVSTSQTSSNYLDPVPADAGATWRIATVTLKRNPASGDDDDLGDFSVTVAADAVAAGNGGTIRIGAIWATTGKVPSGHRMHANRLQLLPRPTKILDRVNIVGNDTFGPLDLSALSAPYQAPPRGAVGAVLRARIYLDDALVAGTISAKPCMVYVDVPNAPGSGQLRLVGERSEWEYVSDDWMIRDMTISGGMLAITGALDGNVDYSIELVGWVLA
jgi:hypothetical protein